MASPTSRSVRRSKPKEGALQQRVLTWLKSEVPGFWFKTHGGPYSNVGVPDIVGCHHGRFIAIELKAPGKVNSGLSEMQRLTLGHLNAAGAYTLVADSLESVKTFMEEIK